MDRLLKRAQPVAVALLLALHGWLAYSSAAQKSAVFDEIAHVGGGAMILAAGDYRFNAESGVLPQVWAMLPAAAAGLEVPATDDPARVAGNVWQIGRALLYGPGADPARLGSARAMIALMSVALGALVYAWSRALYGRAGGALSLVLFAFSPTVLAHARLATADLAAALFFLFASGALWRLLERVDVARFAVAALAVAGVVLAKMSGLLIVPMAALQAIVRLARARPLELAWGARRWTIAARGRRAAVYALLATALAVAAWALVWAAYGGRYAARPGAGAADSRFLHPWAALVSGPGLPAALLRAARETRLLPEAYVWGLAYTLDTTRERDAFAAGRTGRRGWWWFFPYAAAIKTPLALFGLLILAAAAAARAPPGPGRGLAAPLVVLVAVYGVAALSSPLNIGHRHLLPLYPVAFIAAGAAARWLPSRAVPGVSKAVRGISARTVLAAALALLTLAFVAESWRIRPHYLAYFNPLAGGPAGGYRHLVDSSLDWGQDLPALADAIAARRAREGDATPVFVGYFGAAPPAAHGVEAAWLDSYFPLADPARPPAPLAGGVYGVSATLLQTLHLGLLGPWTAEREAAYRRERERVTRFRRLARDPAGRETLAEEDGPAGWIETFRRYRRLRDGRLYRFLRRREPDARCGYSIHVFELSDAELRRLLDGPPPDPKSSSPPEVRLRGTR